MGNRLVTIILVLASIILQRVLIDSSGSNFYYLPFASNLNATHNHSWQLISLLYAYIPIPFILFQFWGQGFELIHGYGKLKVVRSYNKSILILKKVISMFAFLFLIIIFQVVVFSIFRIDYKPLSTNMYIQTLCLYTLMMFCMILFQLLLELLAFHYSNIIINIFFLLSIYIGNIVILNGGNKYILALLYPNLGYASRNGVNANIEMLNYIDSSIFLFIIIGLLISMLLIKINRTDFY